MRSVKVSAAGLEFEIPVEEIDERAAWEIGVELSTRGATYPSENGHVRESLSSLHHLVEESRKILRAYGPDIARSRDSVGALVIGMINGVLRPFLSKWHPLLTSWEATHSASADSAWGHRAQFAEELATLRGDLDTY